MKILQIITKSELGGAQTVVASLAEDFQKAGNEVVIASGMEGGGAAWQRLDPSIRRITVEALRRNPSPWDDVRAVREISRIYGREQPDIVHLHTSKAGLLGRIAPGIPRKHIVYTMHGYFQLSVLHRRFLPLDKAARHLCGAIVAVSENDALLMRNDGYRVCCIPNGVPDILESTAPEGEVLGGIIDLKKAGLPLVMVVARDAGFKRIDLARECARKLDGKAVFVWLGGSPRESDPPGFHAFDNVANAASYLKYADIYLQPSDNEGLSMSLLEALSAGLPSVASSVGGNIECLGIRAGTMRTDACEAIRETDCGFLVPNRADEMAAALLRLCQDSGLRMEKGRAARQKWAERYSCRTMSAEYLSLYGRLKNTGIAL